MTTEEKYLQFVAKNHAQGSGTATSYVTAINKLERAMREAGQLPFNQTLWDKRDIEYLAHLYDFVKREQRKYDGGIFHNESAKSYWQKGFCSAALKQLSQFITISAREEIMQQKFTAVNDGSQLGKELSDTPLFPNPLLIADDLDVNSLEGKTALREVEVRINQDYFRKMILTNYHSQCCVTGLPVVEVLRASHITEWAKDKPNRMNPENGLCLSATYDAAFDRHLISFDDDYRMILSSSLQEYYTNQAFKDYFKKFEGVKITLPVRHLPSKTLLAKHREAMP